MALSAYTSTNRSTLPVLPQSGESIGNAAAALLAAHATVMALGLATLLVLAGKTSLPNDGVTTLSFVLVVLAAWLLISWKLAGGKFLHPYGLFLLAAIPFHVGFSMLRIAREDSQMLLLAEVSDASIARTLVLVTACLAALHLGALTAHAWYAYLETGPTSTAETADDADVRTVGWILLSVSLVPTILMLAGHVQTVFAGGYLELFLLERSLETATPGMAVQRLLSPFFIPGIMFLVAGSRNSPGARRTAFALLTLYSVVYLYVGFRANALIPLAVFAWLWHRSVRRLPLGLIGAAGAGFLVLVAPIIRAVRDVSGLDRLSPSALMDAYASGQNPLTSLLSELGSTVFVVSYTTELVPSVRPHEWGVGYLHALVNAIPMVTWHDPYGNAGDWLAWELRPDWAEGGFGFAYSFIAEAYLNFGWLGAPIMMIAFGAAIVALSRWVSRGADAVRYGFVAAFLPTLIFMVRNESITLSRTLFWYALLPLAAVHFLRTTRRRHGKVEVFRG